MPNISLCLSVTSTQSHTFISIYTHTLIHLHIHTHVQTCSTHTHARTPCIKSIQFAVFTLPFPDGASTETLVLSERGIAPSANSVTLTGLHLHDGDRVRVAVTATNNVDASTTASSDGVTVDLTDPVMIRLVDGDRLDDDLQYTVGERHLYRCEPSCNHDGRPAFCFILNITALFARTYHMLGFISTNTTFAKNGPRYENIVCAEAVKQLT